MKGLVLVSLVALSLVAAATAGSSRTSATLTGICLTQLHYDANMVVNRGTVTCTATGPCACAGLTAISYQTATVSAGNGASGRQSGTITLRGPKGSLAVVLKGTATALGESAGTWKFGVAHGAVASQTVAHTGTYASTWAVSDPVTGTMNAKVHIALTMSCWACVVAR